MSTVLTQRDFEPQLGTSFAISNGGSFVALTLAGVLELPQSAREGGGFRLEFHGPMTPVLPQAIYPFDIDGQSQEIFIVPIGPADGQMRYEAIFF